MTVRSQRHLRELYGRDSAGESDGPTAPVPALGLDFSILTPETLAEMGVTYSSTSLRMRFDETGKLTYGPNNLLLYSNDLSTTWNDLSSGTTTRTGGQADPFGGTTASLLVGNDLNTWWGSGAGDGLGGKTVILSVWLRRDVNPTNDNQRPDLTAYFPGGSASTAITCTVSTTWQQFFLIRQISSSETGTPVFALNIKNGNHIYACQAQYEAVTYETVPRPYHATTANRYYGPRFDYDPATLAFKGILIEDVSTNLGLWSTFTDTPGDVYWGFSGGIELNNALAPDGTMSAAKITAGGGYDPNGAGVWYSNNNAGLDLTGHDSDHVVGSVYVKAGTLSTFRVQLGYSGHNFTYYFDIGTTPQFSGPFNDGAGVGAGAGMQYVGNGWWRLWTTGTLNFPGYPFAYPSYYGTIGFEGTADWGTPAGTETIYIWGHQFELGRFPSTYIPTSSAPSATPVTRTVDTATITTVPALALINADEYSTFVDFTTGHPHGDGNPDFDVIAFSGSAYPTTELPYSDAIGYVGNVSGGWGVINTAGGHYLLANTRYKYAFSVGPNTASGVRDSDPVAHSGSYTKPTDYQTIKLGWEVTHRMGGWIRAFQIYDTRLTDDQLQALTT